jgi:hypothetical protein
LTSICNKSRFSELITAAIKEGETEVENKLKEAVRERARGKDGQSRVQQPYQR